MSPTRVAVALGSGGARGYAHIGAFAELEARGMEVVSIAGTSMGALIGGLAAAGRLEGFTQWATALRGRDMLRFVDPKWSSPGAITADRVLAEVSSQVGDVAIEDLPIPFTAVATDLVARREVWFQRGPLVAAIRASIAIPGVVTPVLMNGRLLVDGGLMNPVPLEPTASVDADLRLAISLNGPRALRESASPTRESAAPQRLEVWRERLRRTVSGLMGPDGEDVESAAEEVRSPFQELPSGLRLSDVTSLSLDAMQAVLTRYRMAGLPPDVLVTIPVTAARTVDFHRASEMVELGRASTAQALDDAGY